MYSMYVLTYKNILYIQYVMYYIKVWWYIRFLL